ncbi:hypothetical protein ACEQ8H_002268 [Pleosporales sp. CAS-2024a]
MSARGQFNTKRILKEAAELATAPSADYHAEPQEDNLFEWHFTIRGPPAPSPYAGGLYHGRILLPPQYPLRPPAFRFLTPSGRFEVNREICLSISGHHEETWQPAWGVRTALVALRSFMDTDAKGQVGGLECTRDAREKMARESRAWTCPACAKSNADIIRERELLVRDTDARHGPREEDAVPDDLRLAYRDELGTKRDGTKGDVDLASAKPRHVPPHNTPPTCSSSSAPASTASTARAPAARPPPLRAPTQPPPDRSLALIDTLIYGIVAALLFMVLKRFA